MGRMVTEGNDNKWITFTVLPCLQAKIVVTFETVKYGTGA